jgi:hypothetical protein
MREIVDILETVVNGLTFTAPILTVTDNGGDSYTLGVDCTYHIQPYCYIAINETDYQVTDIVNDQSITINSNVLPVVGDIITVSAPKYFHGTRPATNEELAEIEGVSDKIPMVYVFEVISENYSNNEENRIERESTIRLFFLGGADFQNWYTGDHYKYAITPMRNLAFQFIKSINNDSGTFAQFDNYTLLNHAKFGIYTDNNGHTNRFFNEDLSGVEMRVTLPIIKDFACSDACNC